MPKLRLVTALLLATLLIAMSAAWAHATEIYFYQRGYVEGGLEAATTLTDAAVAAFARRRPDIRVKVIGVPWESDGDLKLRAALLAGKHIDCFRLAHDELPAFIPRQKQLLSPIDPYLTPADRADFGEASLSAVTYHGETMAWPLWSTAVALLARTDILAARGISPPEGRPWTWAEFSEVLKNVRGKDAAGNPIYGLTAPSLPPLFEWAPLIEAQCGPLFTSLSAGADGSLPLAPRLAQALAAIDAWRTSGLLAPGFGVSDQATAKKDFLAGRVAFMLSSPGFIRELQAAKTPYRILPPPLGAYDRPITTGALGVVAVVDSGDRARVDAAQALARYLTGPDIAAEVPGWYLAPPARTSIHQFYDNSAYAPLRAILPTAAYLVPPVKSGFMERTIIPRLQAAVLGEQPPQAAIDEIQAAARRQ